MTCGVIDYLHGLFQGVETGREGDIKLNAYVEGWAGHMQKHEQI